MCRTGGGGCQLTCHRENPGEGDNYFVDVYKFIGEFSEETIYAQEAETDGFMLATRRRGYEAFAKRRTCSFLVMIVLKRCYKGVKIEKEPFFFLPRGTVCT